MRETSALLSQLTTTWRSWPRPRSAARASAASRSCRLPRVARSWWSSPTPVRSPTARSSSTVHVPPNDAREVEAYLTRDRSTARWASEVVGIRRRSIRRAGRRVAHVALQVLDEVVECLDEADEDRVLTGGVSALLAHPEFSDPGRRPSARRPARRRSRDAQGPLGCHAHGRRGGAHRHENPVAALGHMSFVASPLRRGRPQRHHRRHRPHPHGLSARDVRGHAPSPTR